MSLQIWILTLCQGLFTAGIAIDLTLTGLAGQSLADDPYLATLPFALITVGGAIATPCAGWLMHRIGRRGAFALGTMAGVLGGLISAWSVEYRSFSGFCAGALFVGVFQAFAQYYRLAAADGIPEEKRGRAVATVLAGGVVAAVLGPALAVWSRSMLPGSKFAGAYLAVAVLAALSLVILLGFYLPSKQVADLSPKQDIAVSNLMGIFARPVYIVATINGIVAGAAMVLVMTAAPLAAVVNGHTIDDGAGIMRWHLIGMYAPSLAAGWLLTRYGAARVLMTGVGLIATCVAIAVTGANLLHFYLSLFCLGIGWNLSFVASSALLTAASGLRERLRVQSVSETLRYFFTAAAALAAGVLLRRYGWVAVNLTILPLLLLAISTTVWWVRLSPRNRSWS